MHTAYQFNMDAEGYQPFAENSFAFIELVCALEPGTITLYRRVIDNHF